MLTKIVIACLCLGAALADDPPAPQYGEPAPSYGQPGYGGHGGYGGSQQLVFEIRNLIQNITVLSDNDEVIDGRLEDLFDANELNSILRETFLNELFPNLNKDLDAQDASITALEQKAKALLRLSDDVAVLASTIGQLENQVADVNASTQGQFNRLSDLANYDAIQDTKLGAVDTDLNNQDQQVSDLEARSHAVRDRIVKIQETLHEVFDALNSEGAETNDFILTSDNSEQTVHISSTFGGRRASVQYGITSIHASNHQQSVAINYGYGGYGASQGSSYSGSRFQLPNIYFDTDVEFDQATGKLTARYYDLSTGGWSVDKLGIAAAVFRVDDRIISSYN